MSKKEIWIHFPYGIGDMVMLTGSMRSIFDAYPNEYSFCINCTPGREAVFENLPDVRTGMSDSSDFGGQIFYDSRATTHVIEIYLRQICDLIRRPVPPAHARGWLILSDEETELPAPVAGQYWVMNCSHRNDATTKAWPAENWQRVVDETRATFVRIGGKSDLHPQINGVRDLVKRTTLRELIAIVRHPNCIGVVSGDTGVMHIGAAFEKRLVTVAGDRTLASWIRYPDHHWLATGLPCGWCNKSRTFPMPPDELPPGPSRNAINVLTLPIAMCDNHGPGRFAKCMSDITAEMVIEAMANAGKL
ncbi:MAG TPA: glycosyltransferase family 9 protein [Humisphaera sp.]|jgi:ADP-heptose:LPS heptosyltransferase|nr:glycosyltransferase family 9 protein [Humisphaera sp.]